MNDSPSESRMDGFDLLPLTWEAGSETPGELHAGDLCPYCRSAHLDYNGLLNLVCPQCGYGVAGCFT